MFYVVSELRHITIGSGGNFVQFQAFTSGLHFVDSGFFCSVLLSYIDLHQLLNFISDLLNLFSIHGTTRTISHI